MKHLKKFESFGESTMDKEEMIGHLCKCGWDRHELENMKDEDLEKMCWETGPKEEITEKKNWIKDAIGHPGSLRRSMKKKKGEKISKSEIDSELSALRAKDKDKNKPGIQLGKSDARKYKRLTLAKTLRNMK